MSLLSEPEWHARAAAHETRVDALVADHLGRRRDGVPHPVHDFLFTYYSFRPAQLRRWHPGYGVMLAGRESEAVTAETVAAKRPLVEAIHSLLAATAARPANFGCFGMHEWAMVYRQSQDETRHAAWPLRLGAAGTDEVVESHRIACSHFDAFRFFTDQARPLNTLSPASQDRPAFEQPACLHAGMDLYGKAAVRLMPLIASELLMDAFELAWHFRIVDMRAAPYDFTGLRLDGTGEMWTPIPIETAAGRAEYVGLQRALAERADPIRSALIDACCDLLAAPALGQPS